jgi:predicted CXXCH cytochrome family protein
VATTGALGGNWLSPSGPNAYLLKGTSSTELCLQCHDGKTFAPDVMTADVNGLVRRSAGFFDPVETPNIRGHNLSWDPTSGGSPFGELCGRCHFGGTLATARVQCVDCHNPHGNASFRNLVWASDPATTPPLVAYVRPGNLGLARYEADNVAYTAPPVGVSSWREVSNMCIDCHHTFFTPFYTQSVSPFVRHPGINTESNGTAPINRPGANTDPAFWTTGGGSFLVPRLEFVVRGAVDFAAASVVAPDNQVFCLTCHQAHGSANPFALRWDYGTPTDTGSSGCYQCHNNLLTE